jgi:predicted transcriptional regulator
VGKKADARIREIEETQEALRQSIADATDLAAKAQQLVKKHKESLDQELK